jgi:hypothetical protein
VRSKAQGEFLFRTWLSCRVLQIRVEKSTPHLTWYVWVGSPLTLFIYLTAGGGWGEVGRWGSGQVALFL